MVVRLLAVVAAVGVEELAAVPLAVEIRPRAAALPAVVELRGRRLRLAVPAVVLQVAEAVAEEVVAAAADEPRALLSPTAQVRPATCRSSQ